MDYQDILFERQAGVARITINRPDVLNAFRGQTCEELIHAFNKAGWDADISVIVFAGAGDRAFCTGGDQSAHEGQYDGRGMVGLPVEDLHTIIRDVPKPVIARVQGYAIGGGWGLALACDFRIASRSARMGSATLRFGLLPDEGGQYLLVQLLGVARTIDFLMRKRIVDAVRWAWGTVLNHGQAGRTMFRSLVRSGTHVPFAGLTVPPN